jgi:hypothetical protein
MIPCVSASTASGHRIATLALPLHMRLRRTFAGTFGLFLAVAICGCSSGVARVSIDGQVKYQGKPLAGGEVEFRPAAGPGYSADIAADGTFKVPRSAGPMPGRCRVVVAQVREVSETGSDGRTSTRRESTLPAKYQEQPREITLGKGHNTVSLDLDAWDSP